MSGREWKPGDVAVATVRGVPNVRVFRVRRAWVYVDSSHALNPSTYCALYDNGGEVTDVRPLVVLDPEDIDTTPQETIPYLIRALRASDGNNYGPTLRMLADQIEAQTRPAEGVGYIEVRTVDERTAR